MFGGICGESFLYLYKLCGLYCRSGFALIMSFRSVSGKVFKEIFLEFIQYKKVVANHQRKEEPTQKIFGKTFTCEFDEGIINNFYFCFIGVEIYYDTLSPESDERKRFCWVIISS